VTIVMSPVSKNRQLIVRL